MARLDGGSRRRRSVAGLAMLLLVPGAAIAEDPVRLAAKDVDRPQATAAAHPDDAIAEAQAAMASCRRDFAKVRDYSCVFFKRERIGGKLSKQNVMKMKARNGPTSFYFKFVQPTAGREAIFVDGKHGGKAVVHDVGFGKLLAGTLELDPSGSRAMEGCRHPITDAGIGHMIETIDEAWRNELKHGESVVTVRRGVKVGDRPCVMIESVHPRKLPNYMFHKVKVFIDVEHNLPIRFEAYDWPKSGREPELLEEYIYDQLRLDTGLADRDFDPANKGYSFGRF